MKKIGLFGLEVKTLSENNIVLVSHRSPLNVGDHFFIHETNDIKIVESDFHLERIKKYNNPKVISSRDFIENLPRLVIKTMDMTQDEQFDYHESVYNLGKQFGFEVMSHIRNGNDVPDTTERFKEIYGEFDNLKYFIIFDEKCCGILQKDNKDSELNERCGLCSNRGNINFINDNNEIVVVRKNLI